ncbi:MAG: hypothetical protein ACOXZH_06720 [Bacteroidales bacterium]|jgi:hypothetical protein|nr:hypothetical protein [Bacteroidales bacterium]
MKKSVQFVLLWFYMMLFYIIGHIIGVLFIEGYSATYIGEIDFMGTLWIVAIISAIQIFVFTITKRFRELIIPIIVSVMNIFILSNDPTGYGFEFVEGLIIFTSKFLALLEFVIYDDRITSDFVFDIYWKLLFRFGLGIYLLIVFLSFKLLVVNLTKFCIKKDYKGLLKNVQD